jgi:hypothetical protein
VVGHPLAPRIPINHLRVGAKDTTKNPVVSFPLTWLSLPDIKFESGASKMRTGFIKQNIKLTNWRN